MAPGFPDNKPFVAEVQPAIQKLKCSKCSSPKHTYDECPQVIREISRAHWKSHYAGELDQIIRQYYESEKMTIVRRIELKVVMGKLREAIEQDMIRAGLAPPPDFLLEAFGSTENGFGSAKSDLDVSFRYADHATVRGDQRTHEAQIQAVNLFSSALKKAGFSNVHAITEAKVPIVKFSTIVGGAEIEGDISYYNDFTLHNTRLLKRYCSWTKDDTLSKLGMFVKRWAKQCDIAYSCRGSLSSYTYSILVIHFLQRLQPYPVLPILQEIGFKKNIRVDGYDVYFCDNAPKPDWSKCQLSVGELFLQFLDYFTKFNWEKEVVQIHQSGKVTKKQLKWGKKNMCIQDPFRTDHNLGRGVWAKMFNFIMRTFMASREIFFSLNTREFIDRRDGEDDKTFINRYGNALLAKCNMGPAPKFELKHRRK